MLSKFIARLLITTGLFATALGNYWFTFGLWPQSWTAFVGFWLLTMILMACQFAIALEDEKKK